MTAEITIMNKEAVVLAADSAVTFQKSDKGFKIFQTANKIFTLSKYRPVGIMIYNNTSFMGIPWETIIKIYRKQFGKRKFKKLIDYGYNFIEFLLKVIKISVAVQKEYFNKSIIDYLIKLNNEVYNRVENKFKSKGELKTSEIKQILNKFIKDEEKSWDSIKRNELISDDMVKNLIKKYRSSIKKGIDIIFKGLVIGKELEEIIFKIIGDFFTKFVEPEFYLDYTGLVIVGFGEDEMFPSQVSFTIVGKVDNCLNFKKDKRSNSINEDLNAQITAFAQGEMVYTFMEGINPDFRALIESDIRTIYKELSDLIIKNTKVIDGNGKIAIKDKLGNLIQKSLEDYLKELRKYTKENFADSITEILVELPKNELAVMAETLINLTCFKRKMSLEEETAGGPIDVAVISKGDGFIWIKRKYYFDKKLNPHFNKNYFDKEL